MLKIGLTGGIGSGKSTIAKIFEVLGIPVYYADDAAKRLMNEDENLKRSITKYFGEESYINNELSRTFISRQVFNNAEKLAALNSFVHPATIFDGEQWMNKQTTPYAVKEAALIFESNIHQNLDYIIGVSAPYDLRIERTMKRDSVTRDDVIKRMKNQMDENKKIELCDFVIYNDEEQAVLPQTIALHNQLLQIAKNKNH
jgi:dephospho-CoA kinase